MKGDNLKEKVGELGNDNKIVIDLCNKKQKMKELFINLNKVQACT